LDDRGPSRCSSRSIFFSPRIPLRISFFLNFIHAVIRHGQCIPLHVAEERNGDGLAGTDGREQPHWAHRSRQTPHLATGTVGMFDPRSIEAPRQLAAGNLRSARKTIFGFARLPRVKARGRPCGKLRGMRSLSDSSGRQVFPDGFYQCFPGADASFIIRFQQGDSKSFPTAAETRQRDDADSLGPE